MIKRGLVPKYEGLKPNETAALIHEESSYLMTVAQERVLATGKNVVFDLTVGSSALKSKDKIFNPLERAGYSKTKGAFIDGDIKTSLYRAGLRHMKPDKNGVATMKGRYVPYNIVSSQGPPAGSPYKSINRQNYEDLRAAGVFQSTLRYDNLTGEMERG